MGDRSTRTSALVGLGILWMASSVGSAMPAPGDAPPIDSTVVDSSGAATYRIPLEVPPGPGGLVPRLALAYSSDFGDGPLGVGWRIPLGEIRCAVRFGVPDPASCPQFSLDGELLQGPDADGRYHTFVESFQRIRQVDSAGIHDVTWEVTETDGTRFLYGSRPDARVHQDGDAGLPIARWLLSEIVDVYGNAITFEYDAGSPGSRTPRAVVYAGGRRRIDFYYEPRPDPIHDFAGGIERRLEDRLVEIQVSSGGAVHSRWRLSYSQPGEYFTHRSRLAHVQRFGADCALHPAPTTGCSALPAQEFDYTDPGDPEFATANGWQWQEDPSWDTSTFLEGQRFGDVNGDGLVDAVVAFCRPSATPQDHSNLWPCPVPGDDQPSAGAPVAVKRAVYLNTGSSWELQKSEPWSTALESLTYPAPTLRLQLAHGGPGASSGSVGSPYCFAEPGTHTRGVFFNEHHAYAGDLDLYALDVAPPSAPNGVQTIGVDVDWELLDVNDDGYADLVASARVGGVWKKITADCNPFSDLDPPEYIEAHQRIVFLNTGSGWERASGEWEQGLPAFRAMEISDHFSGRDCELYAWFGTDVSNGEPWSVCRQNLQLPYAFVELNGDGRPDVLALEPQDPRYNPTFWDHATFEYDNPLNPVVTRAWVQERRPSGAYTWVRAPHFDLVDPIGGHALHHMHVQHGWWLLFDGAPLGHDDGVNAMLTWDDGVRFADLNRDGLTDVFWQDPHAAAGFGHDRAPSEPEMVMLNTGTGWCASHAGSPCEDATRYLPPFPVTSLFKLPGHPWGESIYANGGLAVYLRDTTADGLIDIQDHANGGQFYVHSPGSAGPSVWEIPPSDRFEVDSVVATPLLDLDLDGDGAEDRIGTAPPRHLWRSASRLPDLLREVRNGRGGTLRLRYQTAAAQRNASLEALALADAEAKEPPHEVPSVVRFTARPVVTSVTVDGPNRTSATTSYEYARPLWCPHHRSGLGFRLVRRTGPDGSQVDRYFYQDHGRAGRASRRVVREPDRVLYVVDETWELVDPDLPGAWSGVSGSDLRADEAVHVGRLVQRVSGYEYGATPGSVAGPKRVEDFTYDDVYGFNFLRLAEQGSPTHRVEISRTPATPNAVQLAAGIRGLVARERASHPERSIVFHEVDYTYTDEGAIATERRHHAPREPGGASRPAFAADEFLQHFAYDGFGNLRERRDPHGHTTAFCYDGASASLAWCPSVGDGSSLVASRDALGEVTTYEIDPVFGVPLRSASPYRDQPSLRVERDAFGRPVAEFATPAGGDEATLSSTSFDDFALPPTVERWTFAEPGAGNGVRSWTSGDGFGGVWKRVDDVAPVVVGGASRYRCTARHLDPTANQQRTTYPLASDASCSTISGATEHPATEVSADALGRPLAVVTPDGLALVDYRRSIDSLVSALGIVGLAPADARLQRNARGDLVERHYDGSRLVAVRECANAVPAATSLDGVSCAGPAETTLLGYQGRDVEVVYDAAAVAASDWANPRHRLRYFYDTLGRVIEIRDPDAGEHLSEFDGNGSLVWSRNARDQERIFSYDALARITGIATPAGESNVAFSYESGVLLGSVETAAAYAKRRRFDGLGRLAHETVTLDGQREIAHFEHDLFGRRTWEKHQSHPSGVHHVYSGGFLERVCRHRCEHPMAAPLVDAIEYDAVGRPETLRFPSGARRFGYVQTDPALDTRRLVLDRFEASGSSYWLEHRYTARDPLGNVLGVQTSSELGELDATTDYTYDHRNRIASWSRSGETFHYGYDALGNLTGFASAVAGSVDQSFGAGSGATQDPPHAVSTSPEAGGTGVALYDYDASGNREAMLRLAGSHFYRFDSANRLTCVGSSPGGCDVASFLYDATGRLLREIAGDRERRFVGAFTKTKTGSGAVRTRHEVSALGEPLASVESDRTFWLSSGRPGVAPEAPRSARWARQLVPNAVSRLWPGPLWRALTRNLIRGIAFPNPVVGNGSTTHRWTLSERHGSQGVVVDAHGSRVRHVRFRPFGGIDVEHGTSGEDTPLRFAGHRRQPETGLVAMDARWFDPDTGTFLSVDAVVADLADPQSLAAYAYGRNNPVAFRDPSGLSPFPVEPGQSFPSATTLRHQVGGAGRVFGGGWLALGASQPDAFGRSHPLATLDFDLQDGFFRKPAQRKFLVLCVEGFFCTRSLATTPLSNAPSLDRGSLVYGISASANAVASGFGALAETLGAGRVLGAPTGFTGQRELRFRSSVSQSEPALGGPVSGGFDVGVDLSGFVFVGTPREFVNATAVDASLALIQIRFFRAQGQPFFSGLRGFAFGVGIGLGASAIDGSGAATALRVSDVADPFRSFR